MVSGEDHDGPVETASLIEAGEHSPEMVIGVRDLGIVKSRTGLEGAGRSAVPVAEEVPRLPTSLVGQAQQLLAGASCGSVAPRRWRLVRSMGINEVDPQQERRIARSLGQLSESTIGDLFGATIGELRGGNEAVEPAAEPLTRIGGAARGDGDAEVATAPQELGEERDLFRST
jgi:hypothetical protein